MIIIKMFNRILEYIILDKILLKAALTLYRPPYYAVHTWYRQNYFNARHTQTYCKRKPKSYLLCTHCFPGWGVSRNQDRLVVVDTQNSFTLERIQNKWIFLKRKYIYVIMPSLTHWGHLIDAKNLTYQSLSFGPCYSFKVARKVTIVLMQELHWLFLACAFVSWVLESLEGILESNNSAKTKFLHFAVKDSPLVITNTWLQLLLLLRVDQPVIRFKWQITFRNKVEIKISLNDYMINTSYPYIFPTY